MKEIVKRLIGKLGYQITRKTKNNDNSGYDSENHAKEAIAIVRNHTMVSFEPLMILFQQVKHCEINSLTGDYVECGVWKGGASGLMALGCKKYGNGKRSIHMFDIFDDICEPDPEFDGDFALNQVAELAGVEKQTLQGRLQPVKGVYQSHGGPGSVEIVRDLLESKIGYDKDYLHYHKGWFQDTLPRMTDSIENIAILRLDGDLYASTKVCLDFLYKKVVPGGFVIIDDYGTYEGCKKAVDEFREKQGIKTFMSHVNRDCRYWIKE
jgi:O-methyltransferase